MTSTMAKTTFFGSSAQYFINLNPFGEKITLVWKVIFSCIFLKSIEGKSDYLRAFHCNSKSAEKISEWNVSGIELLDLIVGFWNFGKKILFRSRIITAS